MPKGYSNSNPDINSLGSRRRSSTSELDAGYSASQNFARSSAQSNHAANKIPTIEPADMYRSNRSNNYSQGGSRARNAESTMRTQQNQNQPRESSDWRQSRAANHEQDTKLHRRNTQKNLRRRNYEEYSRQTSGFIRTLAIILVTIIYLLVAISGIATPFLPDFNFGTLAPWQVYFARFWLALVLLGGIYAVAVNLFHIRNARFFQSYKALKIILFIVADIAISFIVIRLVCLF